MYKSEYGTSMLDFIKKSFLGQENTQQNLEQIKKVVKTQMNSIGLTDEIDISQDANDPTLLHISTNFNTPVPLNKPIIKLDPDKDKTHSWMKYRYIGTYKCHKCGMIKSKWHDGSDYIFVSGSNLSCDEMEIKDIIE
jgi:hypothetical protein